MSKQTMGEFLALLRRANGFTQQEVADKLNISNRTLSSWETDRTTPDILLLPSIADLYGITVDELLRCERQPQQVVIKETEPQESALDKDYAIFNRRRTKLTVVGIINALIVLTGCITMLFSKAPLWVDVLLICAGVIFNIVIITLIFKQERLAKQNVANGNNAYVLLLRHKTSLSIIINSLVYFAEIAIILISYCNTSVYSEDVLGRVVMYYKAYTAITVSICAAMGIALFLTGVLNNALYENCLGNTEQKNTLKRNTKLLKKISLFGIIPVAVSFIPFIIFTHVHIAKPEEPYFIANGVDEVYKNFQTLKFDYDQVIRDANDYEKIAVVPKDEYYLDFQSETYIEGFYSIGGYSLFLRFYDLGNNFYANYRTGYDAVYAGIYHLRDGITVEDIDYETDLTNYLIFYANKKEVYFTSPNGEELSAVCVNFYYERDGVYYDFLYNYYDELTLTCDNGVYTYQLTNYYDYSPLLTYIFAGATAATVLVCGGVFFIKCKKQKYTF